MQESAADFDPQIMDWGRKKFLDALPSSTNDHHY